MTNIDAGLLQIDAPPKPPANRRHVRQVSHRKFTKLDQRRHAIEHLQALPGPGESLHLALDGTFAAWHLAEAIVELLAVPVDQLLIGTLGFNRPNCDALCELLDSGKVRAATLIVSDYFRSSDRTIFADCQRDLERRGQRVLICRSHAKLLLFDAGAHQIVVETSARGWWSCPAELQSAIQASASPPRPSLKS